MEYETLLVAVSVLAMMSPSVYTIAWSKKEQAHHLPILYVGLAISFLTIVGAFAKSRTLTFLGLFLAFGFFAYVVFFYDNTDNI